jgi:phosphoglycerate dehydrogenase-like enzyme
MTALLVSHQLNAGYGAELAAAARRDGIALELLLLPADREARLADADCARIDIAFFSADVSPNFSRQFFSAARKAPQLKWLHVHNVGVDHPIFDEMLARGVRLTTSSGSTAEPIAQTAIAGLLMLARSFRAGSPRRGNISGNRCAGALFRATCAVRRARAGLPDRPNLRVLAAHWD